MERKQRGKVTLIFTANVHIIQKIVKIVNDLTSRISKNYQLFVSVVSQN